MDPRAPFSNIVVATDVSIRREWTVAIGTIGTRRRTGLARVLFGSGAEAVIHAAPYEVIVARLPGSS
jgi:hypothetical protein